MINLDNPKIRDIEADGIIITKGSDITPLPIEWIWPDWLAKGKLHVLAGEPGRGKTSLCLKLAATITIGGFFPDNTPVEQGDVLMWSGEDDIADTLTPRFLAAGGDLNNIHFIRGKRVQGIEQPFNPAQDLLELESALLSIKNPRLIIIDPLVSAFKRDGINNAETRRDLQPLYELATRQGIALIGIHHLKKPNQQQTSPLHRLNGSVAIGGLARTVFIAGKHPQDDDRSIFVRAKSNNGRTGDGFSYRIVKAEPKPGIHTSAIEWCEFVEGSAEDLLRGDQGTSKLRSDSKLDVACEFLQETLSKDAMPQTEVAALAKAEGITDATLRRAREVLNVNAYRGRGDDADRWWWRLPG